MKVHNLIPDRINFSQTLDYGFLIKIELEFLPNIAVFVTHAVDPLPFGQKLVVDVLVVGRVASLLLKVGIWCWPAVCSQSWSSDTHACRDSFPNPTVIGSSSPFFFLGLC